jgi:predicted heme/steroid binding protein
MAHFAPRAALLLALIAVAGSLLILGCGDATPASSVSATGGTPSTTTSTGRTFTLDELAEFDGKDGRPAYVAVDGVVYDVSASARWPEGRHFPCGLDSTAGRDLSDLIKQAPANMRSLLERMPVVGSLAQ